MISRRTVLRLLGYTAAAPSILIARQEQPPELKRSRWELLFGNPETGTPSHKPDPKTWDDSTITAAWIGHATVLINFFGTTIITDPVFSDRIGLNLLGLTTLGPRRLMAPALAIHELPRIDLILLSHAHMDHLDLPSLEQFDRSIPVIAAKNTSDVLDDLGLRSVTELDWGQTIRKAGLEIEAIQTKHFGWRFPWEVDRSRGNWNGRSFNAYRISKNGRTIVFGGDTAIQGFFKEWGEENGPVDLAMMPIGAYDPWIFNHCNPEQALAMAQDLKAKVFFPMHWGTFIQSDEPTHEPIQRLKKAIAGTDIQLALEEHGQTWTLKRALAESRAAG